MNKEEQYFGIRFNEDIPKIDKINEYKKEVEIKFIGTTYLVERKDDKIEKTEIKNYHKLDKEGKYEIEFVNSKQEMYVLQVSVKKSYLFFIILFLLGILLLTICFIPFKDNQTILNRFMSLIDFKIMEVDIEGNDRYVFDVDFKNIVSSDIELTSTIDANSKVNNKIAPGTSGEFSIIISTRDSTVDMKYSVDFEDVTKEKPSNLLFKAKGRNKEYSSLHDLEKYLRGFAEKETQTEYIIEWYWAYEINDDQDKVDTNDGMNLENYKFRIHVYGEEAI